jgi:DNA-binding Lrp family transcriptional regulator
MKPYSFHIDRAIIDVLYKRGRISSRELNKAVAKHLGWKRTEIEKKTFLYRLHQMTERKPDTIPYLGHHRYTIYPVLKRDDKLGIGKQVYYSLSEQVKIMCALKLPILWNGTDEEKKYQLLLLVMLIQEAPIDKIKSESFKGTEEFHKFLARIHVSRKELKPIDLQLNKLEGTSITTLYNQSDVKIFRIDSTDNLREGYYTYKLSGTSLDDILNHSQYIGISFPYLQLTEENVNKYLELLEEQGLIKRVTSSTLVYLGEIRYNITDRRLRDFLNQCWSIHDYSIWLMRSTWSHNRGHNKEEETWYRIFFGPETSKNHFEKFRGERKKLKSQQLRHKTRQRPQIDDIHGYDDEIKKRFDTLLDGHSETIEKYSYFANMLMEWVYPSFLRELQQRGKI